MSRVEFKFIRGWVDMAATLLEQNPWLRDPKQREALLRASAASSSAVEGIHKPFAKTVKPIKPVSRKTSKSSG